MIQISLVFP